MTSMLSEALQNSMDEQLAEQYPYVRRDKMVRARVLAESGHEHLLIETRCDDARKDPVKRRVLTDQFHNNYWIGKD